MKKSKFYAEFSVDDAPAAVIESADTWDEILAIVADRGP